MNKEPNTGEPVAYVNLERWKVCDNPEHCFSKSPDDGDIPLYSQDYVNQLLAEIEALKNSLKQNEELTKAWILYATKIEMLMPTMCETNIARDLGWSFEYLKGYNDAIREVKALLRKASEK